MPFLLRDVMPASPGAIQASRMSLPQHLELSLLGRPTKQENLRMGFVKFTDLVRLIRMGFYDRAAPVLLLCNAGSSLVAIRRRESHTLMHFGKVDTNKPCCLPPGALSLRPVPPTPVSNTLHPKAQRTYPLTPHWSSEGPMGKRDRGRRKGNGPEDNEHRQEEPSARNEKAEKAKLRLTLKANPLPVCQKWKKYRNVTLLPNSASVMS
ncbi:hypothetical protein CAPTEDRAFT_198849 [Capitella teleta]|uniref:Uncharacterized protein n=1 Tax=Capitella teleta TaxID=283909 RepID=R7T3W9_CAPTE|nr:hypothetical protein CAPTEDRAFT_198849 [Capitella teleta]|eukprot:ELT87473.1 hypothetical protein CAPTEDRAFT_198849 [Capitella teleta]